jgi:drug/metabolite transporter superfamily protein YnfA
VLFTLSIVKQAGCHSGWALCLPVIGCFAMAVILRTDLNIIWGNVSGVRLACCGDYS